MATISFEFDPLKAAAAVAFLASHGLNDLTSGKICRLLFLADKLHLVRYGRTITGDLFTASATGPMPSKIQELLDRIVSGDKDVTLEPLAALFVERKFKQARFALKGELKFDEWLSRSDIGALEETLRRSGGKSTEELTALIAAMPAFVNARRETTNYAPPIKYEDFFIEDSDAVAGSLEEAIEDSQLRDAFAAPKAFVA